MFLPHVDVFCDLLLNKFTNLQIYNRHTATFDLIKKKNYYR